MHPSFIVAQQLGSHIEITGFGGAVESTEGHIQLTLRGNHGSTNIAWSPQCTEGLNEKPIKIVVNPSPFNQNEANFMENMFYDELAPGEEYPISRTLGAPILEEEET